VQAGAGAGRGPLPAPFPYARQVSRAKFRARRRGYQGDHFTGSEWLALVAACGGRCLRCGDLASLDLTVDHIVPLALGGTNTIENIQPLCSACNGIKGCGIMDYRTSKATA
jgi:5-methylcytosine-specific restriction endonuclease McrA